MKIITWISRAAAGGMLALGIMSTPAQALTTFGVTGTVGTVTLPVGPFDNPAGYSLPACVLASCSTVTGGLTVSLDTTAAGGLTLDGGNAIVEMTYLGKEAGFNNLFDSPSVTGAHFSNNVTLVGATATDFFIGGLLPVSFTSDASSPPVANGGAPGAGNIAFYILSPTYALLLFNDSAPVDGDYDDMAVLLHIRASCGETPFLVCGQVDAPLPAGLPLLASGLGVLGLFREWNKRRRLAA